MSSLHSISPDQAHARHTQMALGVGSALPESLVRLKTQFSELVYNLFENLEDFRRLPFFEKLESILGPHLVGELWSYVQEILRLGALLVLIPLECVRERRSIKKEIEILRGIPTFQPFLEDELPHVLQLGKALKGGYLQTRICLTRLVAECSASNIIGTTPAEAIRIHEAELAQGKWRTRPLVGRVRLHFYRSLERGRHQDSAEPYPKPDIRIDLDFDPRTGLDLNIARKAFGVDSLAVITDVAPFRTVFDPASQERLSPIAVCDLSKRFSRPIRVFEPRATNITTMKRKIHEPSSLCANFIVTLVKCLLGFTFDNHAYTSIVYGKTYASACSRISHVMRPINLWVREGGWLIVQLVAFVTLLPFIAAYQCAFGVQKTAVWSAKKIANLTMLVIGTLFTLTAATLTIFASSVVFAAFAVINTVYFFSSLSKRGWLLSLALCWLLAADHYALN